MTTTNKPTTLFWIVAIILVVWNLMGAGSFILDNFFTDTLAATYTPEQMQAIRATPVWAKIFYGIATIGGLIAALLLIARKSGAVRVYLISLISVILHTIYNVGFANGMEVFGVGEGLIFPLVIVLLALFEYWWSTYCASKGWLN